MIAAQARETTQFAAERRNAASARALAIGDDHSRSAAGPVFGVTRTKPEDD